MALHLEATPPSLKTSAIKVLAVKTSRRFLDFRGSPDLQLTGGSHTLPPPRQ
ncbi:hypothetical protein J6590_094968 [Homalodisca vitripennis]|nr:hypothetical protein J6590_094968 [Homalodisca vitripennis]